MFQTTNQIKYLKINSNGFDVHVTASGNFRGPGRISTRMGSSTSSRSKASSISSTSRSRVETIHIWMLENPWKKIRGKIHKIHVEANSEIWNDLHLCGRPRPATSRLTVCSLTGHRELPPKFGLTNGQGPRVVIVQRQEDLSQLLNGVVRDLPGTKQWEERSYGHPWSA